MSRLIYLVCMLIYLSSGAEDVLNINLKLLSGSDGTRVISSADGDIRVSTDRVETSNAVSDTRTYEYPNGDVFFQQRLRFENTGSDSVTLSSVEYEGTSGTVKYYSSEDSQWHEQELTEGRLPFGMYFITVGEADFFVCLPQVYVPRENDMLEELTDYKGWLEVEKTEKGFQFDIASRVGPQGSQAEYMYLTSSARLIDWSCPTAEYIWSGYQFTGKNRWCYDGYYYEAPSNYIPTGENYYHRLVAAYIPTLLVAYDGIFRGGDDLCIAMLDVMLELQNDEGYFPTKAGSQWLLSDYGIGAGFYDTRFNCDLVTGMLAAYKKFGISEFYDAAVRYGEFFLSYAEGNHFTFYPEAGIGEGWLVYDYGHEKEHKANHSSLNHMIAQISLLYSLEEETGRSEFAETADKMLMGIKLTADKWIMADNNLEYAYMPDGTMGLVDYPYLTYNDLYKLQKKLITRSGQVDSDIQRLMKAKKAWMDSNGIIGYLK